MAPLRARFSANWPDPSAGDDSPVALLIHGFGSDEDDLVGLAPVLPSGIPWASPRAPIDMDMGGATWFPLALPAEPDYEDINKATEILWQWVDANVFAEAPIVPLGFSQGGLMALQLLRTRPARVAATVVMSGFITRAVQPADGSLEVLKPPVFWGRGTLDPMIGTDAVRLLGAWLPRHTTPTAKVYDDLTHGINDEEMGDVRSFLAGHVGPRH